MARRRRVSSLVRVVGGGRGGRGRRAASGVCVLFAAPRNCAGHHRYFGAKRRGPTQSADVPEGQRRRSDNEMSWSHPSLSVRSAYGLDSSTAAAIKTRSESCIFWSRALNDRTVLGFVAPTQGISSHLGTWLRLAFVPRVNFVFLLQPPRLVARFLSLGFIKVTLIPCSAVGSIFARCYRN